MNQRSGEKAAWIGGWIGAFIWVLVLAIVLAARGATGDSALGFVLLIAAVLLVVLTAPWRHGRAAYWKLMVPLYIVFFASIVWAFVALDYGGTVGTNWWCFFWVFPLLLPLFTMGRKRWEDD
ncbi:MAG: hypothetical protein JXB46_08860 [Candidatus Eisenbacteria bacterium]|nr:hypothetical protein [Candidatus Eisenbacteria bacterium]